MLITRKEEHELPEFNSHEVARTYFVNHFGDKFVFESSEMIGDQRIYFYVLGTSEQSIQISEDGTIHIVY